ncbi:MAG: hypothetical protein RLZ75_1761 [Pseudomonadota bacterium]
MSYYDLIIPDFIKALELDNPINKRTQDVYSGVNCPECNHEESFVYIDTGFLRCNRANKCGAVISPQKQYPDLFKDIAVRFPSTPENPLAPQIAYLFSRGLDHTKINFSAGRGFSVEGKNYPSIAFNQDGVKQERLIDYHGKDKNRLTEYSGKVWKTAGVDSSSLVFVTEGIFNAESLAQSGFPAIATYSSVSIPAKYFEVNKSKEYVIAFDNDEAGRKGTDKLISLFTELSIKYSVAMSPRGKDWNDLLVDESDDEAVKRLDRHCELRKYRQKADQWFGICIGVNSERLRFGVNKNFKWEQSDELDTMTKDLHKPQSLKGKNKVNFQTITRKSNKVGRNENCPCGSGEKYKKCCLK